MTVGSLSFSLPLPGSLSLPVSEQIHKLKKKKMILSLRFFSCLCPRGHPGPFALPTWGEVTVTGGWPLLASQLTLFSSR